jgi:urea transporter
MSELADAFEAHSQRTLRQALSAFATFLRVYAECFFGRSLAAGALVLIATAFAPYSALLGALAVGSAIGTAYALGLVSAYARPSEYGYSALFIGLAAGSSFAHPTASLALATLGGVACAVLTASLRGFFLRFGLPSLSLPFVIVYFCAISLAGMLGVEWALAAPATVPPWLAFLPPTVRTLLTFLEEIGAILFIPRIEVGLVVIVALCACRWDVPLLAGLAFALVMLVDRALSLSPALRSTALFNAMFASIGLGTAWSSPGLTSYLRAATGALFCILFTVTLAEPLARLGLTPVSLPFNLGILSVLLLDQQRAVLRPSVFPPQ